MKEDLHEALEEANQKLNEAVLSVYDLESATFQWALVQEAYEELGEVMEKIEHARRKPAGEW